MKRTIIIALLAAVSGGMQAQTKDSIDMSQFVAVYDFVTNTKDKDGKATTDSVQLAVVVGTHAAKCMEFNRTRWRISAKEATATISMVNGTRGNTICLCCS